MGHSEVVDGLIKDGERGKGKRARGVVDGLGSSIKENWTRGGGGGAAGMQAGLLKRDG